MLEIPGFTYSACGQFTKSKYIYQNELDKAYIQHDMAYADFKDLPRRTARDKVLHNKLVNVAKIPKHDEYQRDLAYMIYNFLMKSILVVLLHVQGQRP